MKSMSKRDLSRKLSGVVGFPTGLVLLLIIMMCLSASEVFYEIQQASASSHLGILGRPAPELNLNNWIDADGEQRAPRSTQMENSGHRFSSATTAVK
jgi:hypothetical protein